MRNLVGEATVTVVLALCISLCFPAGDEIVDVTVIDDGWMEGRVKRTGNYGMLPSNYVEKQ